MDDGWESINQVINPNILLSCMHLLSLCVGRFPLHLFHPLQLQLCFPALAYCHPTYCPVLSCPVLLHHFGICVPIEYQKRIGEFGSDKGAEGPEVEIRFVLVGREARGADNEAES